MTIFKIVRMLIILMRILSEAISFIFKVLTTLFKLFSSYTLLSWTLESDKKPKII